MLILNYDLSYYRISFTILYDILAYYIDYILIVDLHYFYLSFLSKFHRILYIQFIIFHHIISNHESFEYINNIC